VLEIGCGSVSQVRDHFLKIGANWEGIDIQMNYFGHPTIATRIESVEAVSFGDETFDFVIGNQTLEHWDEFGCRPELGLWQCFRVCKPNGIVIMNVPIRFHGSRIFVEGDMIKILDLFNQYSSEIKIDYWHYKSYPLASIDVLEGYKGKAPRISYILDIRANRNIWPVSAPKKYIFRSRIIREIIEHPLGYHWFRINRKLKLIRRQHIGRADQKGVNKCSGMK
jgi:SAM-dependent methyltransferase